MSEPVVFPLGHSHKEPSNINLKSKVAIDRAQIAPFRKLEKGLDLSVIPSVFLNPPDSISAITRAMQCRIDASQDNQPLLVTELAASGPDSDFTMSMDTLTSITSALELDLPLDVIFVNIEGNYFFDEVLHHNYNPWSPVFSSLDLKIDESHAEEINLLSRITAHAFDPTRQTQWFGIQKDGLVTSERSQQRWCRETEKLLPSSPDHFSRSFACNMNDITLHVGTNSILCEIDDHPTILRYSKEEPSEVQKLRWKTEAMISACHDILLASSEDSKLTRYDLMKCPESNKFDIKKVYDFFGFVKKNCPHFGCHIIHKQKDGEEIQLYQISFEDIQNIGLEKSYRIRLSRLETALGFRQTLSLTENIVNIGRRLLYHASALSYAPLSSLCFERIADSYILPILLLNRNSSLILPPITTIEQITVPSYDRARQYYEAATKADNLPQLLLVSLHQKLATARFAEAQLIGGEEGEELALAAYKEKDLTNEFKFECILWRCQNAQKIKDFDKARRLSCIAFSIANTDEQKIIAKREIGHVNNADGQLNLETHRYTRASERFEAAKTIFQEINDNGNLAKSEANLAHIERCLAVNVSIKARGEFTFEEESRLGNAEKYYLIALDRLSNYPGPIKNEITLNLASLYISILTRYTQSPPFNRMKSVQVFDEASRVSKEATELIASLKPRTSDVNRQAAALDTWKGRFIAEVRIPTEEDPAEIVKLGKIAESLYNKARQFFIADTFPADFVSITVSLSALNLNFGKINEAMKILLESLRAYRPTALAIRHKNASIMPTPNRAELNQLGPMVLSITRDLLKELLRIKMVNKQKCDEEKRLYGLSLKINSDDVADLLNDVKKSIKI